jgi:hypothetical protein
MMIEFHILTLGTKVTIKSGSSLTTVLTMSPIIFFHLKKCYKLSKRENCFFSIWDTSCVHTHEKMSDICPYLKRAGIVSVVERSW